MTILSHRFSIPTRGHSHVVDITPRLASHLSGQPIRNGIATIFVVGSTAAITTTEYEPGLAEHDLPAAFERIAPIDGTYEHERRWNDDNGHAHVRASLLGPSLTIPLVEGALALGTWQQIVLVDFDTRPREREVIVQVIGE